MSKIKKIIQNIITSGITGEYNSEAVRKAIIINLFSFVGVSFMLIFGFKEIEADKILLATVLFMLAALMITSVLYLRLTKDYVISGNIALYILFILMIFLIASGTGMDKILWCYTFPLASYFVLGKKQGGLSNLVFIIIAIFLLYFPLEFMSIYPNDVKVRFIASYIAVTLLAHVFEMVREKTFEAFIEADRNKTYYLTQTLQQKEEILAQSEQLEFSNKELEKLSIVASKTNNAVIIMDKNGRFEWVNDGFVRLYGFSINQLIKENRNNIIDSNSSPKVKSILYECIENKQSCSYESQTITNTGKKVWIQTTVTPIFGNNNEIIKLVAIDTNIGKLKQAQEEIQQQHEEITAQKDALEQQHQEILVQKVTLELQNGQILKQKNILERHHSNINSSLLYAQTIQQAILPQNLYIKELFNFFLIYKAKDIVSGDFYWMTVLPKKDEYTEKTFIAVVDCTGHGVPGAFMSMIGNSLLNQIVNEKKTVKPNKILKTMDIGINYALNQDSTDNSDGMDICFCVLEKVDNEKTRVIFAGAKRPLFYNIKGTDKISIIKGDRKSIGGYKGRQPIDFTNHEIILNKGDRLYLTTDGYIDQNNPERKRFGTRRFVKLLESILAEPLDIQKAILTNELKKYQDNSDQRDDITVFAFEI